MITARFEFHPGEDAYFCPGEYQEVVEVSFESVESLVETVRELEPSIRNCVARIGEKVVDLRAISGLT
jgi:hypothetical protein